IRASCGSASAKSLTTIARTKPDEAAKSRSWGRWTSAISAWSGCDFAERSRATCLGSASSLDHEIITRKGDGFFDCSDYSKSIFGRRDHRYARYLALVECIE